MVVKNNSGLLTLMVGTRKGAFFLNSEDNRRTWKLSPPTFLGHIVHHMMSDPRDTNVILMAVKTGHLGPTVFRSLDGGKNWTEASSPPAFRKRPEDETGPSVDSVFWLTPGHASEKGVWYAGTTPPGIFRSEDNGDTWQPVPGFNDGEHYPNWTAGGATPGGAILHSIIIDPRDPSHMYASISVGGTFESTDKGATWTPLNKGIAADFLPDPDVEYGHDPHCVVMHPADPDRLYQQNHCGIYTMDRPAREWVRVGKNMPPNVGDIGFPMVVHPRNRDVAWVFPMDGTEVWPRTSPEGKPAVFITRNAGKSWERMDKGLPPSDAYLTVKRQSMTADNREVVGLYFGTTCGEVWASNDEGAGWNCIARHLPEVYSLTVSENNGK